MTLNYIHSRFETDGPRQRNTFNMNAIGKKFAMKNNYSTVHECAAICDEAEKIKAMSCGTWSSTT